MGCDAAFTDINSACASSRSLPFGSFIVSALVFKKTVEWRSMAAKRHGTLHAVSCYSTADYSIKHFLLENEHSICQLYLKEILPQ